MALKKKKTVFNIAMLSLETIIYENLDEEKKTIFNLDEFRKKSTLEEKKLYLQETCFFLNHGTYREVYQTDNNTVIKIAIDHDASIKQNTKEIKIWECSGNSPILVKIIDYDKKQFEWLLVEKVDIVYADTMIDEETCLRAINRTLGVNAVTTLPDGFAIKWFVNSLVLLKNGATLGEIQTELDLDLDVMFANDSIMKALRYVWPDNLNTWTKNLIELIENCGLSTGDFHCGNWGVINGEMVLIDYGY